MRKLLLTDKRKRGCDFCTGMIPWDKTPFNRSGCPYDKCPYHELDDTETYGLYLRKHGDMTVDQLLKAMGKDEEDDGS